LQSDFEFDKYGDVKRDFFVSAVKNGTYVTHVTHPVIPAKAGIHIFIRDAADSCFRRNDSGTPDLRPAA
jgi:hypothetical protein